MGSAVGHVVGSAITGGMGGGGGHSQPEQYQQQQPAYQQQPQYGQQPQEPQGGTVTLCGGTTLHIVVLQAPVLGRSKALSSAPSSSPT